MEVELPLTPPHTPPLTPTSTAETQTLPGVGLPIGVGPYNGLHWDDQELEKAAHHSLKKKSSDAAYVYRELCKAPKEVGEKLAKTLRQKKKDTKLSKSQNTPNITCQCWIFLSIHRSQ